MVRVNEELIESGKSEAGGWNSKQLSLLGVSWPPRRGWKKLAIGTCVSKESAEMFVLLRGKTAL